MSKSTFRRSNGSFNDDEKHVIIQDYLKGGKSKDDIWRKYTGKADHGHLLSWMRDLGYLTTTQQILPKLALNGYDMAKKKHEFTNPEDEYENLQLKNRIADLEKQLKDAELKAIAFSTMVDIAEKEFKISIRKKCNTKQ
jgi:transposase